MLRHFGNFWLNFIRTFLRVSSVLSGVLKNPNLKAIKNRVDKIPDLGVRSGVEGIIGSLIVLMLKLFICTYNKSESISLENCGGPLNIGGRARWPSGRIFTKKSAYAGFYPDKISKFLPKAKFLVRAKIASYSEARWISALFFDKYIWSVV